MCAGTTSEFSSRVTSTANSRCPSPTNRLFSSNAVSANSSRCPSPVQSRFVSSSNNTIPNNTANVSFHTFQPISLTSSIPNSIPNSKPSSRYGSPKLFGRSSTVNSSTTSRCHSPSSSSTAKSQQNELKRNYNQLRQKLELSKNSLNYASDQVDKIGTPS